MRSSARPKRARAISRWMMRGRSSKIWATTGSASKIKRKRGRHISLPALFLFTRACLSFLLRKGYRIYFCNTIWGCKYSSPPNVVHPVLSSNGIWRSAPRDYSSPEAFIKSGQSDSRDRWARRGRLADGGSKGGNIRHAEAPVQADGSAGRKILVGVEYAGKGGVRACKNYARKRNRPSKTGGKKRVKH